MTTGTGRLLAATLAFFPRSPAFFLLLAQLQPSLCFPLQLFIIPLAVFLGLLLAKLDAGYDIDPELLAVPLLVPAIFVGGIMTLYMLCVGIYSCNRDSTRDRLRSQGIAEHLLPDEIEFCSRCGQYLFYLFLSCMSLLLVLLSALYLKEWQLEGSSRKRNSSLVGSSMPICVPLFFFMWATYFFEKSRLQRSREAQFVGLYSGDGNGEPRRPTFHALVRERGQGGLPVGTALAQTQHAGAAAVAVAAPRVGEGGPVTQPAPPVPAAAVPAAAAAATVR